MDVQEKEKLLKFRKAMQQMISKSKDSYTKTDRRSSLNRQRHYSGEEIRKIVACGDPVERAELSELFFESSGLYKRIIVHYATFLTYSWILVPHLKNKRTKLDDKKNSVAYYNAADFINSFQVERKCALFAKDILLKGAYYGILHDNGDKVVIQDLPFEFCRSRFKNQDDVDLIEFNLSYFDTIREDELRKLALSAYPKEVQKAYAKYKNNKGSKWIFLNADTSIYFCFFDECPFFLDLIPLIDDLDDYKNMDKKRTLQALKRILVQKVGTHEMKLLFEPEEAYEMHEGVIEMTSNNDDLDVLTTYNTISLLDLSSNDDNKTEIKDVQQLIYESAGVSKELFCATTEAGIDYSLNNDLSLMMILGYRFAYFYSILIDRKFGNSNLKFYVLILPISYYNYDEYTSRAKELAAFGYSFITPILGTGINQMTLADLKDLENNLYDFDEILIPLQSSYTQSGKVGQSAAAAAAEKAGVQTPDKPKEEESENKKEENNTSDKGGEK